jgi:hypothetical protein
MALLSCHEPGTTETYGGSDFLLPDLRCRFSTAERREAAVASAGDRILFFLPEGTICFGMNFNRLWQLRTRKLPCCVQNNFFREQLALPSALNIGAGVVSPIRHQN